MSYDAYMEHGYGIDMDENPFKSLFLGDLYNLLVADTPDLIVDFEGFEDFDETADDYMNAYGDCGIEAILADYLNEKFFSDYRFFKYEGGCLYVPDYMPSTANPINPTKEDIESALRSINVLFASPAKIQSLTVWIS